MAISGIVIASLGALLMTAGKTIAVLDSRREAPMENALIAIERLKREVQESPVFPSIPFSGEKDRLAFPRIAAGSVRLRDFRLGQAQNAAGGSRFQKVEYYFDDGRLIRREEGGPEETVLSGLDGVRFSYASGDPAGGPKKWRERTPSPGGPERIYAMEVRIKPARRSGKELPEIGRSFILFRRHPLSRAEKAEA